MIDVVPLLRNECSRAGEMLERAFRDDPLWAASLTDSDRRPEQMRVMFKALIAATLGGRGVVEKTAGLEGVAVWHGPQSELGFRAMVRSGFALPRFVMSVKGVDRRRMMGTLGEMEKQRKAIMPDPHWYIAAIGVDPEVQGSGFGSALLRHGMNRAREAGLPIYLETETKSNLDYYLHHGFEVVGEFIPKGLDVHLWLMAWDHSGSRS